MVRPKPPARHRHQPGRLGRLARVAGALGVALLVALPAGAAVRAADPSSTPAAGGSPTPAQPAGLSMGARVLLDGHVRSGAWMAIDVDLANDGPPLVGEIRLVGGTQGRTRFAVPVDLPTTSRKSYTVYAQAPAFGSSLEVALVVDETVVASRKVAFALHDTNQLVIGVIAEQPAAIVGPLAGLIDPNSQRPAVVSLRPDMLPVRAEAWAPLDRLVWQDVDASALSTEQLGALRTWLAAGGRLTILGGTGGPAVLGGFPDELLPYRPAATLDADPATLRSFLGALPGDAATLPALAGTLAHGRTLASSGDRVIAADMTYGTGAVTLVGFDPTIPWIAKSSFAGALWARLVPLRSGTRTPYLVGDDSGLVNLLGTLPAVALPPVEGLLVLLLGYVLLIGPVNYLVLRRLDRREWAWITMPLCIAGFAVAAFAYGAALRGNQVVVNEVAIVRGAPGTDAAQAQVYLGIFSPTRGDYDVRVPGGALLTAPYAGESIGGTSTGGLDIVQTDPSRIRGLAVGYGQMRAVRAETPITAPRIEADLALVGSTLRGTVRNASDRLLARPAVVLGSNALVLPDLAPGASTPVVLPLSGKVFESALSERVFGQQTFPSGQLGDDYIRETVRRQLVDLLTYDPFSGSNGTLPADGPVLLAWATGALLDVQVGEGDARQVGDTLFYIPLTLRASGHVVFGPDLVRSTVLDSNAQFFSKDPFTVSIGAGSATIAYRPIAFDGRLDATRVVLAFNTGGIATLPPGGADVDPVAPTPEPTGSAAPTGSPGATAGPAQPPDASGLPAVEVWDLQAGAWRHVPNPTPGVPFSLRDPARYVDPGSGTLLLRFTNDRQDGIGFQLAVQIEGTVR